MAYSLLYYLPRDVARRAPETQHLPGQFVREAQDAGDDRVVASRTVARAVGRRAAAEHQASQSEHLLGNYCFSAKTRGVQYGHGHGHFLAIRLGFDPQNATSRGDFLWLLLN